MVHTLCTSSVVKDRSTSEIQAISQVFKLSIKVC